MRARLSAAAVLVIVMLLPFGATHAQDGTAAKAAKPAKAKKEKEKEKEKKKEDAEPSVPQLYRSEKVLPVTLTANLRQLRGDKSQAVVWRGGTLSYAGDDGKPVTLPISMHTHGIWRLKNCQFPPLRLKISGKTSKHTVFHDVGKPKLVNFCRDNEQYEQYVLQELQLYRIYQLLTPASHRVRLLRLSYADSATTKTEATRYAFMLEDPDQMAERLHGKVLKLKGAGPGDFDPGALALAYLFEYMIGNTDFSFAGLHNTEIIGREQGETLPVVYDFDFSGAVNTTYATADPSLKIRNVRTRLYRGYCLVTPEVKAVAPLFQQKKAAIYALYSDEIGRLLSPNIAKETLAFFDEFYRTLDDPRSANGEIYGNCVQERR